MQRCYSKKEHHGIRLSIARARAVIPRDDTPTSRAMHGVVDMMEECLRMVRNAETNLVCCWEVYENLLKDVSIRHIQEARKAFDQEHDY
jgi:hypothetical protein